VEIAASDPVRQAATADGTEESTMMYGYGEPVTGWGYALGITLMIVFCGALIAAITAAVRYLGRGHQDRFPPEPPGPASQPPGAEQVLADRFARGEIDAEEYRQLLEILREGRRTAGSRS
jgi:putative membrane protein